MNVFSVNVCVIVFLDIFLIECTVQRSRVALMLARHNYYYKFIYLIISTWIITLSYLDLGLMQSLHTNILRKKDIFRSLYSSSQTSKYS